MISAFGVMGPEVEELSVGTTMADSVIVAVGLDRTIDVLVGTTLAVLIWGVTACVGEHAAKATKNRMPQNDFTKSIPNQSQLSPFIFLI